MDVAKRSALSLVVHFGLEKHIKPLMLTLAGVGAAQSVLLGWTLLSAHISLGALQSIVFVTGLVAAGGYVLFQEKVGRGLLAELLMVAFVAGCTCVVLVTTTLWHVSGHVWEFLRLFLSLWLHVALVLLLILVAAVVKIHLDKEFRRGDFVPSLPSRPTPPKALSKLPTPPKLPSMPHMPHLPGPSGDSPLTKIRDRFHSKDLKEQDHLNAL